MKGRGFWETNTRRPDSTGKERQVRQDASADHASILPLRKYPWAPTNAELGGVINLADGTTQLKGERQSSKYTSTSTDSESYKAAVRDALEAYRFIRARVHTHAPHSTTINSPYHRIGFLWGIWNSASKDIQMDVVFLQAWGKKGMVSRRSHPDVSVK
jgi:hypothetical protein